MLCDYNIIKKENLTKSTWSGGTTTELAIFPKESSYISRDFTWRLSCAQVEQESSKFTELKEFNRILMILDGKMELNHNGVEIVKINAFEQNEFGGENATVANGKAEDFNLIMRKEKCSGKIKHLNMQSKETVKLNDIIGFYNFDNLTQAIYAYNGDMNIKIGENTHRLSEKDLLLVDFKEKVVSLEIEFENLSDRMNNAIIAHIFY